MKVRLGIGVVSVALILAGCGVAAPSASSTTPLTPELTPPLITTTVSTTSPFCPDVPYPRMVLGGNPTRERELVLINLDGTRQCDVTLQATPRTPTGSGGKTLFYEVIDEAAGTKTLWTLGSDGVDHPLAYTESKPHYLPFPFVVSEDGNQIAYTLVTNSGSNDVNHLHSRLYVATVDGSHVQKVMEAFSDEGRVLQPIRFNLEQSIVFYSMAPTAYGGMWNSINGRYENLYKAQIPDGEPHLIFDCRTAGLSFCIGDVATDGSMFAYVNSLQGVVEVATTEGARVSTLIPPATDYIGFPTFSPIGELAFISASFGAANQPPAPEPGYVSVVAPPYTQPLQTWLIAPGIIRLWQWADADHLVLFLEGEHFPPADVLGRDGSIKPLHTLPLGMMN